MDSAKTIVIRFLFKSRNYYYKYILKKPRIQIIDKDSLVSFDKLPICVNDIEYLEVYNY